MCMFLETYHSVESAVGETLVIFSTHWTYLNGEVVEVRSCSPNYLLDIVGSIDFGVLT